MSLLHDIQIENVLLPLLLLSNDATPLAMNPDIIPDVKPTITPKPVATEVKTSSKGRDKELTVTISSSDVNICKPQVARRGKPLSGPNRQPDRKQALL